LVGTFEQKEPRGSGMKLFAPLILSCLVADTQSAPRPRQLTMEEARSILKVWIRDATQRLPGVDWKISLSTIRRGFISSRSFGNPTRQRRLGELPGR
jgi:hypothetical protein